ncbi:MAG: penicillin acylase family protein [Gemmatimonadota bacterium]
MSFIPTNAPPPQAPGPRRIAVPYRTAKGLVTREFTAWYTPHGPVVRSVDGKWVTISLMNDPMHALMQSYGRTKAHSLPEFLKVMELHTNSSNNTLFADASGNIAYLHSNYIPRRDSTLDWSQPVDGSATKSDYHGVLSLQETPNAINPATGWAYNSNNWPWSAAGSASPRREDFPRYVERGSSESMRGLHALRVLSNTSDFTMSSLTAAAFDSYQPGFAITIPALLKAFDAAPASDSLRNRVAEQVARLRSWDYRWGAGSVETSLAVFWGTALYPRLASGMRRTGLPFEQYVAERAAGADLLAALSTASAKLTTDFVRWQVPWGEINRFQRLDDNIEARFDDTKPSIAVPFTSALWGSLASYGSQQYPNTRKWYGTSGNSFVAVVEFGDSVRARAVTAGGESGNPASPHFNDEAERYATGALREVYFYPSQLKGHTERVYHPGL